MELLIKNMVCDRCIRVVKEELADLSVQFTSVELGKIEIPEELNADTLEKVKTALEEAGFEVIYNRKNALVDVVKKLIIEEVQHLKREKPEEMNFSTYLAQKTGYEYSYLSHLFSQEVNLTIEQYIIAQRIEKAKEYLSYNELSVSEIAWELGYSSVAHLSSQFKKVTGLSPAQYKKEEQKARIALDQIGLK